MDTNYYLSLQEVAQRSGLSRSTLRQHLDEIPHRRVGRRILIKWSSFERWLMQANRTSPWVDQFAREIIADVRQ